MTFDTDTTKDRTIGQLFMEYEALPPGSKLLLSGTELRSMVPGLAARRNTTSAKGLSNIECTLEERGSRYGSFDTHAKITQDIKSVMCGRGLSTPTNWEALTSSQREAFEMIAHKIGRILNGDPNYINSWHDIAGYATLIEQELAAAQQTQS